MGKAFKKITKVIHTVTNPLAKQMNKAGLPTFWDTAYHLVDNIAGTDLTGEKADAKNLAAAATARQEALLNSMTQQAANVNVDLGMENVPDTEVGGTASSMADSAKRRRRNTTSGVSTSLGINV